MAVSRGLVAQNGRCIRCFASPLTNRASACGMAAQVQIDQQRINGTPLQTPPCLQYTAHASCSKHRSVVPGDASGSVRASVSPTCSGFQFLLVLLYQCPLACPFALSVVKLHVDAGAHRVAQPVHESRGRDWIRRVHSGPCPCVPLSAAWARRGVRAQCTLHTAHGTRTRHTAHGTRHTVVCGRRGIRRRTSQASSPERP